MSEYSFTPKPSSQPASQPAMMPSDHNPSNGPGNPPNLAAVLRALQDSYESITPSTATSATPLTAETATRTETVPTTATSTSAGSEQQKQYRPRQALPATAPSATPANAPIAATTTGADAATAPAKPSTPLVDPSTITTWPAALKHVMKTVGQNEELQGIIRKLIRLQHDSEKKWWSERNALLEKQRSRAGKQKQLDDVLYVRFPFFLFLFFYCQGAIADNRWSIIQESTRWCGAEISCCKGMLSPSIYYPQHLRNTPIGTFVGFVNLLEINCLLLQTPEEDQKELDEYDKKVYRELVSVSRMLDRDLRSLRIPFFAIHYDLVSQSDSSSSSSAATTAEGNSSKNRITAQELGELQKRMLELLEDLCNE